jgi:membrane protease subunit (stomatin/prohibitin family)
MNISLIESSATGENFEEVGRVQGAGNSTQTLHYTLKDYNFSPTTYYLLKQVDFDGTVTSHQVIVVNRKELYGNLSLNVFPNPTNGELTIRANTLNAGEYEIRVVNTLGMTVHVERTYLIEGVNDRTIDFSHLAKGIYSIEINSGQDRKVVRFVKQ